MTTAPIVVAGGGFAGVFAARQLRRQLGDRYPITLLSPQNHFVFQPLLPEVAAGIINIQDAVSPLRALLPGVKVGMAEVQSVDFAQKQLHFLQGQKKVPQSLQYRQLVLACGLISDFSRFPGFTEHTLGMKHLADAYALRNRVIHCLEHADITKNAELKRQLLTFVVIGGGFSGVETVGEMTEMLRRTLRYYPSVSAADLHIVLIQHGDRILMELPQSLADYATEKLSGRGIQIRCNTGVTKATASGVELSNGDFLDAATVVTTIGNGPTGLVKNLDLPTERGRILVDRQLRVKDRPDVWALGDAALVPLQRYGEPPRYAPPTAQFAVREADCLARNMKAVMDGLTPCRFSYKPRGALASIGNYRAVAEVFGRRLSGLPAWVLWRGFYLAMLPGVVTRLRVALNWALDYFVPRNVVQVDQLRPSSCRYLHLRKGSIVFRPNELVDGLYTVVEGELESRVQDTESGEDYVRILKPGDHWGERVISHGRTTVGQLKALSDAKVLLLGREEFLRLCESLPPLQKHFAGLQEENYPPQLRQAPKADAQDSAQQTAQPAPKADAQDSAQQTAAAATATAATAKKAKPRTATRKTSTRARQTPKRRTTTADVTDK